MKHKPKSRRRRRRRRREIASVSPSAPPPRKRTRDFSTCHPAQPYFSTTSLRKLPQRGLTRSTAVRAAVARMAPTPPRYPPCVQNDAQDSPTPPNRHCRRRSRSQRRFLVLIFLLPHLLSSQRNQPSRLDGTRSITFLLGQQDSQDHDHDQVTGTDQASVELI